MNNDKPQQFDLQSIVKEKESVSLELFNEIKSEFWYLTRLFSRQSSTGQSQGRSITAEAKTQSKNYSSGLLLEVITILSNEDVSSMERFDDKIHLKKACERVIKVHEDNQLKIDTERHLEKLRLILVPVYQKSEEIIREQFKPSRKALTLSFDSVQKVIKEFKIPIFKESYYTKKNSFNNADIYPILKNEAENKFDCDFSKDFHSAIQRRNVEAARRFVADLSNCFRFGLTATLDRMEQDHFEAQIAKLESNLVKYIPIGIDEINNFTINPGPKGFELIGQLLSKGKIKKGIKTFAHAAGGWNIQSFHYRYKTNLFEI